MLLSVLIKVLTSAILEHLDPGLNLPVVSEMYTVNNWARLIIRGKIHDCFITLKIYTQ